MSSTLVTKMLLKYQQYKYILNTIKKYFIVAT